VTVLEVDEHEHRDYTSRCDVVRVVEIVRALWALRGRGTKIRVVRYNPDAGEELALEKAKGTAAAFGEGTPVVTFRSASGVDVTVAQQKEGTDQAATRNTK